MPVVIKPTPQEAGSNTGNVGGGNRFSATDNSIPVIPLGNAFVENLIKAFHQDQHLLLRPDDVWLAIATQLSNCVNANAESLRGLFVSHEGKKNLEVDARPIPVEDLDFGRLSQQMTHLIHENVVDDELRGWIMPNFTTTEDNDKSVAAIVMMGTLQKFFEYTCVGGCGFPSVTLLGEPKDWEEILRRVERLPIFGVQSSAWSRQLSPIIKRMIASFFLPDSQEIKDFWRRACYSNGVNGSGSRATLSGWITAFCFWSETGKCLDPNLNPKEPIATPDYEGDAEVVGDRDEEVESLYADCVRLELDGVKYHLIYPEMPPHIQSSILKGIEFHLMYLQSPPHFQNIIPTV